MAERSSNGLRGVMRFAMGLHAAIYRASGGKIWGRMVNLPILLITTYGRKTGKPFTNPVVYVQDGKDYLVTASAGGADQNPGWFFNLEKRPEAKVQIGGQVYNVRATITGGEERDRLYEKFKAASNNFVKYEEGTERVIPVVRLEPVDS